MPAAKAYDHAAGAKIARVRSVVGESRRTDIVHRADRRTAVARPDRAEADAVCAIQAFCAMLVRLASRRGGDPDQPPHLQKVARTK